MKDGNNQSNFVARFWKYLTVQFTSDGGGIGAFLTLFLMLVVFAIAVCFIFRSVWFIAIPFLGIMLYLISKFIDKFFGLADKPNTQKLFFTPDQRMDALKLEYKYGSDRKALELPKSSTKLGQPQFASSERGAVITGILEEVKP